MLLRFASGVPHGFRDRQRFELVPKTLSSQIKAVFARIREQHTRQNKPYQLGAVRAGVVGARGRGCPPATVPVAVVWPCGVCCCIAENKQNFRIKSSTEKQSSANIVHKPKRTATSTRTIHKANQALPAWRSVGRSSRDDNPLLSSSDGARSCSILLLFPLLFC